MDGLRDTFYEAARKTASWKRAAKMEISVNLKQAARLYVSVWKTGGLVHSVSKWLAFKGEHQWSDVIKEYIHFLIVRGERESFKPTPCFWVLWTCHILRPCSYIQHVRKLTCKELDHRVLRDAPENSTFTQFAIPDDLHGAIRAVNPHVVEEIHSRLMEILSVSNVSKDVTVVEDLLNELHALNLELDDDLLDHAIDLYKCHMHLSGALGERVCPSTLTDLIWHMHMLHVKAYRADCEAAFGLVVNHAPFSPDVDRGMISTMRERTDELWRTHFGASASALTAEYARSKHQKGSGIPNASHAVLGQYSGLFTNALAPPANVKVNGAWMSRDNESGMEAMRVLLKLTPFSLREAGDVALLLSATAHDTLEAALCVADIIEGKVRHPASKCDFARAIAGKVAIDHEGTSSESKRDSNSSSSSSSSKNKDPNKAKAQLIYAELYGLKSPTWLAALKRLEETRRKRDFETHVHERTSSKHMLVRTQFRNSLVILRSSCIHIRTCMHACRPS
jgi:hypothetical protein